MSEKPLAEDFLPSIRDISAYIYGNADEANQRRVRRLIAERAIPSRVIGGRITSRRTWILASDAFKAEVA